MKNKSLSFFLFITFVLLNSKALWSQEDFLLKGKIITDSTSSFHVNIINITQHQGQISKKEGNFEIPVKPDDEVLFSAIGYKNKYVIISDSIIDNSPIEIILEEEINVLSEVKLSSYNLSGDLAKDASQIEAFNQTKVGITRYQGRKMTQTQKRLYTASSSSLDYLLNVLSGRIKQLKKLEKNEKLEKTKMKIHQLLDETFFEKHLNLPEENIEQFLYFCLENLEDLNALQTDKPFALIEYLEKQSVIFKENMNLD